MAEPDTQVELACVIGEDASWQLFWTDEYGDPVPIADPVLADVKDANGQIAARFATTNDPLTQAYVAVGGPNGFFQLTMPAAMTRLLAPGRYVFDLFAAVADSTTFNHQLRQVVSGWMVASMRVTKIEDASEMLLSSNPGGI